MSERAQQKMSEIDRKANDLQRELEKNHVRKLQKKAFLCGAKCCEDVAASAEEVQKCIENCHRPILAMQNNLKQELDRFQSRIQRCVMSCQDAAQDSVSSSGEAAAKEKYHSCVIACADDHLKLMPAMKGRLIDSLPQ